MVASGTATLEAALFKKPMVITYRLSAFNWQRMKNQSLLPWVGLPNILCRDFVVPELIQHAATSAALAHHTMRCLQDTQIAQQVLERFTVLHETLRQNTPALISQALEPYLR
jgi:lipid-A-disaccharide synthase